MNYLIERLDNEVSRLILHWQPNPDTSRRPSIARHCRVDRGSWMTTPGAVLGFERQQSCAIVINVRRGDLITLRNRNTSGSRWSHFRVGPMYELSGCPIGNRKLRPEDWDAHAQPENPAPIAQPATSDDDLRAFLAKPKRARWLRTILDRQIETWRLNRPAKYFNLVPGRATSAEIARCVGIDPFTALRFFKKSLSPEQVDRCIRGSIEGGVIFAFERLTAPQMRKALRECPGTLLTHHADALNDEQFFECVRFDPFAAIYIRQEVPPHRHAVVLAHSFTLAFPIRDSIVREEFQKEIELSITRFPAVWLRVHKSIQRLVECLENWTEMRIDNDFLLRLLVGMPAEHQGIVARYMAERI